MATDTLHVIDVRIKELEAKLAESPEYQELVILRDARKRLVMLSGQVSSGSGASGTLSIVSGTGKVTMIEGVNRALEDAKHPLSTRELVERLPKYGARAGGAKPRQNLTSVLSKRGNFKNIPWGGGRAWWFKDRSLPDDKILGDDDSSSEKEPADASSKESSAGSSSNPKPRGANGATSLTA